MGQLRFKINYRSIGSNIPGDIASELSDLSEPFENIITGWALHNAEKFKRSIGQELNGVDQAADTHWKPVTEQYYRQKHGPIKRGARTLFDDWLMVRTGDLMRAMIDPDLFFSAITATQAAFGQPADDEDAAKVAGNWIKRQIIFLDNSDKRMIQSEIHDYLMYGRDYKKTKNRKALMRNETMRLDLGFREAING